MELPKNIVQIGKPDPTHKIFVEDYVISYMKQWNKHGKRDTGIVLFGKKMTEGECRYYFVYGATYIPGVEARMQYLTEEEREQAEEVRAKFFAEYELLGWGELRGELPEGFYMLEQNKGVWIRGYACFFEKNESMLGFMVTEGTRGIERQAPILQKESQETTYVRENNIDARMEERNRKLEQIRSNQSVMPEKIVTQLPLQAGQPKSWKNAAMVMALIVCVVAGLVLTDEGKRKNLEAIVSQVVATATKEATKLKDNQVETLTAAVGESQVTAGTNTGEEDSEQLDEVTEEKVVDGTNLAQTEVIQTQQHKTEQGNVMQPQTSASEVAEETTQEQAPGIEQSDIPVSGEAQVPTEQEQEVVARYVSYTIQKGDTLLSICRIQCGSEGLLQQVCQLNNIENPDDIKIGQTILLPE